MKMRFCRLFSLGVVVLHGAAVLAAEGKVEFKPVLAQNIADNVIWTRRTDTYTLQVVTQWRVIGPKGTSGSESSSTTRRRELPSIDVQLLKKDGQAIAPVKRWQTPTPKPNITVPGHLRPEVLYAFPLSTGSEAVAVVVCTDGNCLTGKIAPFVE